MKKNDDNYVSGYCVETDVTKNFILGAPSPLKLKSVVWVKNS